MVEFTIEKDKECSICGELYSEHPPNKSKNADCLQLDKEAEEVEEMGFYEMDFIDSLEEFNLV